MTFEKGRFEVMRLSMKSRKELTREVSARYRNARKKDKSQILSEFVASTGYNRSYAALLLRNYGKKVEAHSSKSSLVYVSAKKNRRAGGRPPVYTQEVVDTLIWLWELFNFKCGKHLAPIIKTNIKSFRDTKEFSSVSECVINALEKISPATIDRLLTRERHKMKIRGHSYTRGTAALKDQIPIRTFGDWKNVGVGYFQIDCVGHEGGIVSGQCCFTLTGTDVATGWVERRAVLNRASRWITQALDQIIMEIPFPILELHPDNGSEFINMSLLNYSKHTGIDLTRSRPGKKNDNCYVEQKNFDTVRKLVGYARYTTPEALEVLNEIYHIQGLLQNYIYPTQKLIEKTRNGSRYVKKYDKPKTPAMRILEHSDVDSEVMSNIRKTQDRINPIAIALKVKRLQKKLFDMADKNLSLPYPQKEGA
jgi:hypothetical protein